MASKPQSKKLTALQLQLSELTRQNDQLSSLVDAKQIQLNTILETIEEEDNKLRLLVSSKVDELRRAMESETQANYQHLKAYRDEEERLKLRCEELAREASIKKTEADDKQRELSIAAQSLQELESQKAAANQVLLETDDLKQQQERIREEIASMQQSAKDEARVVAETMAEEIKKHKEIINSLKESKESILKDIYTSKLLLGEYEKSMFDARSNDEIRSTELTKRELSLDAKQRALLKEKQELKMQQRQFYATREL